MMRRSLWILGWAMATLVVRGEDVARPAASPTAPAAPATSSGVATNGPRIRFVEQLFDFGRVSSGTVARHDFVFTNVGNAVLEVSQVRPGCGCTMAGEWDRRVEPGATGKIPIQFNSAGFSGTVSKSATVTCNDPTQPSLFLQFRANIWRPIDTTPASAYFNLASEMPTNETRVVRIVNNMDAPLTLSEPECTNQSFHVELATVKPGKEFELRVTAQPPFASAYVQAPVTIKTSSTNMPVLTIRAYANIQPAIQVVPSQIILPASLPPGSPPPSVTIRNSGTNDLLLSNAAVNLEGASVSLREVQPGRLFTLGLTVPPGLQLSNTQRVEITLKSNHPKFPEIKVPVFQPQPPALARTAAPAVPRTAVEGIPPLLARPATVTTVPNPAPLPASVTTTNRPLVRAVPPLP